VRTGEGLLQPGPQRREARRRRKVKQRIAEIAQPLQPPAEVGDVATAARRLVRRPHARESKSPPATMFADSPTAGKNLNNLA